MTARSSPAALRNREPIAKTLAEYLPTHGRVLMIAEGSGEHAVYFAHRFPGLHWLPTDPSAEARASIEAHRNAANPPNLGAPQELDAASDDWPITGEVAAITCINMVHISPWAATEGLMRGAARTLADGGVLYLYGPYRRSGLPLAPSNAAFHENLRSRNPDWGLRALEDVAQLADRYGLALQLVRDMPANNLSVVFRRA